MESQNTRTPRAPQETDQEQVGKALALLVDLVDDHSELENVHWAGAFCSWLVIGLRESGFSYSQFCEECERVKKHYESWFEPQEGIQDDPTIKSFKKFGALTGPPQGIEHKNEE